MSYKCFGAKLKTVHDVLEWPMQGQDSQNLMGKHSLLSLPFSVMTMLCLKFACQILSSSACITLKDPLKTFLEKLDTYESAKYK